MSALRGGVVLGVPRSGTTLVRRLLDAHPELSCPPETGLLSASARFLRRDRFDAGLEVGVVPALAAQGVPDLVSEPLRAQVFGWLDALAARRGKPRWVEKTATDVFHLGVLGPWLGGHVAFVGVLRHGLDVAASLDELAARTGGFLPELHPYVQRHPRPLVAWAHAWADATTALLDLAAARPTEVHLVRYESLVADPGAVLPPVLAHLGVDPAVDVVSALSSAREAGLGDWRTWERPGVWTDRAERWRTLSPVTRADLAPVVDPVLVRAGYAPVGAPAASIEGDRRQRLAQLAAGLRRPAGTPEVD